MRRLVCLGSVNANEEDRFLSRKSLAPVQRLSGDGAEEIRALRGFGVLGVSSIAWDAHQLFLCTGTELHRARLDKPCLEPVSVDGLVDVHEIDLFQGQLWLSNTGKNELIALDPETGRVAERLRLPESESTKEQAQDRYHCNQAFPLGGSRVGAVVHHVDGRQRVMTIGRRIQNKLKQHGNGGLIDARTGEVLIRGLKAPHSVRRLPDGGVIICDSGNFLLRRYDSNYRLIESASTRGWGRGVAVCADAIYVGVSATRKRYLSVLPSSAQVPNMILAFDATSLKLVDEILLEHVEQVNNVYPLTPELDAWFDLLESSD